MSFQAMFKKGDLFLLAMIILVTWLWSSSGAPNGSNPIGLRIVTTAGEDTLALLADTLLSRGDVVIEISGAAAAIIESDCPAKHCIRTGWISEPGQISACMPNGVFIEILGEETVTDVVTY